MPFRRNYNPKTVYSNVSHDERDDAVAMRQHWRWCTESLAHRGSVSDAPLSSVLDENFLHASIFDVFALVGSVQRIGHQYGGH